MDAVNSNRLHTPYCSREGKMDGIFFVSDERSAIPGCFAQQKFQPLTVALNDQHRRSTCCLGLSEFKKAVSLSDAGARSTWILVLVVGGCCLHQLLCLAATLPSDDGRALRLLFLLYLLKIYRCAPCVTKTPAQLHQIQRSFEGNFTNSNADRHQNPRSFAQLHQNQRRPRARTSPNPTQIVTKTNAVAC